MMNEAYTEYAVRASLIDFVDKQIMIQLKDGKQIIGDIRSFDQVFSVVFFLHQLCVTIMYLCFHPLSTRTLC